MCFLFQDCKCLACIQAFCLYRRIKVMRHIAKMFARVIRDDKAVFKRLVKFPSSVECFVNFFLKGPPPIFAIQTFLLKTGNPAEYQYLCRYTILDCFNFLQIMGVCVCIYGWIPCIPHHTGRSFYSYFIMGGPRKPAVYNYSQLFKGR